MREERVGSYVGNTDVEDPIPPLDLEVVRRSLL